LEYQDQYDPNQDFAIFGIGDKTKGGIQSMQEKMNMADGVSKEGSSSYSGSGEVDDSDGRAPSREKNGPESTGARGSRDAARSGAGGNTQTEFNNGTRSGSGGSGDSAAQRL